MSDHTAKAKILYIEDDPFLRQIVSSTLEEQGLQVRTASNGQEGVAMALEWLADLILMDLKMPIMDGFQATKALQADPRTRHIPIVAFSAAFEPGIQARTQAAGMNGFIQKPISPDKLVRIIRAYLPG
jgi:CheY-like chemotaxis protein